MTKASSVQVKEKCLDAKYRTIPFSERPSASELDVEWRSGVNGRMVLQVSHERAMKTTVSLSLSLCHSACSIEQLIIE